MATYTSIPSSIIPTGKIMLISDVAAGDQIDVRSILGRAARGVKFTVTDEADIMEYKLNSLVHMRKFHETTVDETILVWSGSTRYPTLTATGQIEYVIEDEPRVDSIEIVSLSLSTGTTIEIVVW